MNGLSMISSTKNMLLTKQYSNYRSSTVPGDLREPDGNIIHSDYLVVPRHFRTFENVLTVTALYCDLCPDGTLHAFRRNPSVFEKCKLVAKSIERTSNMKIQLSGFDEGRFSGPLRHCFKRSFV